MNLAEVLEQTDNITHVDIYFFDNDEYKNIEIIGGELGYLLFHEIEKIKKFLNKRVIRIYLDNNVLCIVVNSDIFE